MRKAYSKRTPEFEPSRDSTLELGDGSEDSFGFLRVIEHGAPHPLIRWHRHEEYELHLITATNGKMFVGDYIGDFKPGNLVLTGPLLPHTWVSEKIPKEGIVSRDLSVQFLGEPFRESCKLLPELNQIPLLLDRAKSGVEFYGISDFTEKQILKIKSTKGISSFNEFLILMSELSRHSNYKLLSNMYCQNSYDNKPDKFKKVVDYIIENYDSSFTLSDMAKKVGMEDTQFSRCFSEVKGCTFTNFVNHIRVNKACQLLSETDKYISTICYEIGYNTVANFNRRFFDIKKITPSQYRKESRLKY